MKTFLHNGLSASIVARRFALSSRHRTACRNKSTFVDKENSSSRAPSISPSPESAGSAGISKSSQPLPHNSATASVGAAVPSIPDASSRSWRQLIKASPLGKAAGWYGNQQHSRPYWTQLWSTLVIFLCADLCAQLAVPSVESERQETSENDQVVPSGTQRKYDPIRTLRHLTVGAVAAIPVYKWFMFLHRNFNYPSKALSILTKVAVSQSLFTPTFNLYFFTMQSLLAGASLEDTWERVKIAVPNSVWNSIKVWPGITAFLFLYVEPQFRSIVSGVAAVGWQTYLSWLDQRAAKAVRDAAATEKISLMEREASTPILATPT